MNLVIKWLEGKHFETYSIMVLRAKRKEKKVFTMGGKKLEWIFDIRDS